MSTDTTQNPVSKESVTIAVMGATGAGKSTFINLASAAKLQVGEGLESCTAEVTAALPFLLDDKYVTLVDTPGFDDTVKTEAEILRLISTFLAVTYEANRRLNGVIFLHRISDVRVGGVAKKNFRLFRKLCGDETLRSVVIATNMWSEVAPEKGEAREHELATNDKFFKPALDKGARMVRHDNTVESAHSLLRTLMEKETITLAVQREMVNEGKTVAQTSAGLDLQAELNEQMDRHREEIRQMKERMEALLLEKDSRHQEELSELNEAVRDVREQMRHVQSHSDKLLHERVTDRKWYEAEAQEMARVMQEREDKLRDLYAFAQEQKDMLVALKEELKSVQQIAGEHAVGMHDAEEMLKAAQDAHRAELAAVRQEFEEKVAAVVDGSTKKGAGPQAVPDGGHPSVRQRTKSQVGPRKAPPGFFAGLAVILDQLFVPSPHMSF
ncbi:P-loop containing nucleoside triphosphate hydrolase protein [Cristinia sonorae]|uniref:P-loop containing nucleoside triphosphate hydrolase protein n=1 Tax=Cristinia sonorae TaxID=1940300 RepID=A0A8K0XMN8_9AGAR|nr:P-loop containing nucleoside triphosphate hydrolase protein [Cristinia sonorae]